MLILFRSIAVSRQESRLSNFLWELAAMAGRLMEECPVCKRARTSKFWSPAQWNNYSAGALVDGWWRNCCKDCSTVPGWYFNEAGPKFMGVAAAAEKIPSDVSTLSLLEVASSWAECFEWLRKTYLASLGIFPRASLASGLPTQGSHPAERTTFSFETHVPLRCHPGA